MIIATLASIGAATVGAGIAYLITRVIEFLT